MLLEREERKDLKGLRDPEEHTVLLESLVCPVHKGHKEKLGNLEQLDHLVYQGRLDLLALRDLKVYQEML